MAGLQQICLKDNIAVLISEKDSKSTEGMYQNIFQEYLASLNVYVLRFANGNFKDR